MGKQWLSWVGGGGGGGGNSRSSAKRGKMASGGCMCAVFHLFHVHHIHLPSTHRNHSYTYPFIQEEPITTTGVEAPRNSLELNETKQEEDIKFPVGIKIKTSKSKAIRLDDISSECDSPGSKTPSVVARLMGLDLLPKPQCTSPSITKSRKDTALIQIDAARSLPETPRTSSSSRKSDVERHRLSLQINKENAFSPSDGGGQKGRLKQDDKRIRSVGLDITNTYRSSDQSKKKSKMVTEYGEGEVKQSISAPKVERNSSSYDVNPKSTRVLNQIPVIKERQQQHKESKKASGKCKKQPARAAASRREDGFVGSRERKKSNLVQNNCKRTPLSCSILNGNGPTLVQVKIGAAKLPQKQSQVSDAIISWKSSTQLSSKPSQPYRQLQLRHNKTPTTVLPCSTAAALHGGAWPEHRNYIQILLKHTGIINQLNPIAKWHAPSLPIDPRIFQHLELKDAAGFCHRWERKLIFQLVDELLAENLTRQFRLSRRIYPVGDDGGYRLVEELCKKIVSFPAAKCVVLEDIDSLIDKDLGKVQWDGFWGEEEDLVREIEGEIVEWLVGEAVAVMGGDSAEELVFVM